VSQIEQSAIRNRLLTSLPPADFGRLAASLTPVTLSLKQFLVEAEELIGAAYFIETGIISYLNYLEGGEALEIGLIGSEGMTIRAIQFGKPVPKGGVTLLLEPWPDTNARKF
jgi:hypothetical protein